MKKVMLGLVKFSGFLASFALVAATMSNNVTCMFVYHQPKAPQALRDLAK